MGKGLIFHFQIIDIPEPAGYERPIPAADPTSDNATSIPAAEFEADSTESTSSLPSRPKTPPPATAKHSPRLFFDPNWLAIIRTFNPFLSLRPSPIAFPPKDKIDSLLEESTTWVLQNVGVDGVLCVDDVQKFGKTAPATGDGQDNAMREFLHSFSTLSATDGSAQRVASWYTNPQTVALCTLLDIENKINPVPAGFKEAQAAAAAAKAIADASKPPPTARAAPASTGQAVVKVEKSTPTNGGSNGTVPSAADELAAAKRAAMAELDLLVVAENEDEIVMDDEDI